MNKGALSGALILCSKGAEAPVSLGAIPLDYIFKQLAHDTESLDVSVAPALLVVDSEYYLDINKVRKTSRRGALSASVTDRKTH